MFAKQHSTLEPPHQSCSIPILNGVKQLLFFSQILGVTNLSGASDDGAQRLEVAPGGGVLRGVFT